MIKFNIQNGKAVIDPITLTIKEFKDIWESDKSKTKELATNHLTYIYHMCDVESPFSDLEDEELMTLAARNSYGDVITMDSKTLDLIQAAIKIYTKLNESCESRLIPVFKRKLDSLRNIIDTTEIKIIENTNAQNGNVTFTTNTKIITTCMTDLEAIMAAKDKIEARLNKEKTDKKIRGQKKPSGVESGKFKINRAS